MHLVSVCLLTLAEADPVEDAALTSATTAAPGGSGATGPDDAVWGSLADEDRHAAAPAATVQFVGARGQRQARVQVGGLA